MLKMLIVSFLVQLKYLTNKPISNLELKDTLFLFALFTFLLFTTAYLAVVEQTCMN